MIEECLAYDDVLLVPKYSAVLSRTDESLDTSTIVGGIPLRIPFIASPMDTVSEVEMCVALGKMGGMGVLHRFLDIHDQIKMAQTIAELDPEVPLVVAIGVNEYEKDRFNKLEMMLDDNLDMISIDIANGHHILMTEMVKFVRSINPSLPIMAGNVATRDGFEFLADLGVNAVRVGIGSGSICSTRIQSGFGVPVLTSVLQCAEAKIKYPQVSIIADGGIKYPKDVNIALAAGADAVMTGSLFAGTKEAPGDIIYTNDGKAWKRYRGMASAEVQQERRGGLKPGTIAEGVSQLTEYKGSLERVINEFVGGLRLGMAYGNARNIADLRNVEMVRITSSGITESHAFGTRRR